MGLKKEDRMEEKKERRQGKREKEKRKEGVKEKETKGRAYIVMDLMYVSLSKSYVEP